MKKIIIFLLFISISVLSFSQELKFGMQITGTASWLLNKQMFDDGHAQDPVASSFGEYFGPSVTFKFPKPVSMLGVELGLNFNVINQKYKGDIELFGVQTSYNHYESSLKYKSVDIPIMLIVGKKIYFEFGGVVHVRGKVRYNRTFEKTDIESSFGKYNNTTYACLNVTDESVESAFKKSAFGWAIGVGADLNLPLNFVLNVGLRVNYIPNDMEGINGLMLSKNFYSSKSEDFKNFYTKPIYGGIRIGLRYKLSL